MLIFIFFVTEAAYRFYKTKCEEESLKRTGKDVEKKRTRRRHERVGLIQILIIKFTVRHQMITLKLMIVLPMLR